MLFEEFFKKKKISLDALQRGDAELFSEFKNHYEQMGEKSFDHTKKYWFNNLRHLYPLPPEVKAEKVHLENSVAEQTVADTLTEPSARDEAPKLGFKPEVKTQTTTPEPAVGAAVPEQASAENAPAEEVNTEAPAPKLGFKPKFKAGVTGANTANEIPESTTPPTEPAADELNNAAAPAPKLGFKPKFKAGVTGANTAKEIPESTTSPTEPAADELNNAAAPAPKLGFKPKFKAGVTTTKPQGGPEAAEAPTEGSATPAETDKSDVPASKLGFKPKFKAGVTTSKPAEPVKPQAIEPEAVEPPVGNTLTPEEQQPSAAQAPGTPTKIGFKPRFKAGVTGKAAETNSAPDVPAEPVADQQQPADREEKPVEPSANAEAKPAYKPRFNPKMMKPKPPEENTDNNS